MVWSTKPTLASVLRSVDPSVLVNLVNAVFRLPDVSILLPYTRARWFENHKNLSAVDKFHKLCSPRLLPAVWARSVGLGVVNELDTIKAALMIAAGGSGAGPRVGSHGWGGMLRRGVH
jgi:2-polyprenyl-6-methoxyphenol hydroxylase-like FAD-dependent oxidoreductase